MVFYLICERCGSEYRTYKDIGRNKSYRDWLREKESTKEPHGYCNECYPIIVAEDRANETKKALDDADVKGLPILIGSEKQIAWAAVLRRDKIKEIEGLIKRIETILSVNLKNVGVTCDQDTLNTEVEILTEELISNPSAKWWIDNRHKDAYELMQPVMEGVIALFLPEEMKKLREENMRKEGKLSKPIATAKKTEILYPEEQKHVVQAKITLTEKQLLIVSEKDNTVIEYCRKNDYKWDGSAWVLTFNFRHGEPTDRYIEAINNLLLWGFPVEIEKRDDFESIKERAIKGEYTKRIFRWVSVGKEDGKFIIGMQYGDNMYNKARSLPGAKWESGSGIKVPAAAYKEIQEFAEAYYYGLSPRAKEVIAEEEEKANSIERLKVVPKKKEKPKKEGIQQILETSPEVLDDLKDNPY
jgi:hypothetical protein